MTVTQGERATRSEGRGDLGYLSVGLKGGGVECNDLYIWEQLSLGEIARLGTGYLVVMGGETPELRGSQHGVWKQHSSAVGGTHNRGVGSQ